MHVAERERPRLRPLEAIPDPTNHRVVLRDPTQLAAGLLVVGEAELCLLTLLDGQRRRVEIQAEYARRSGQLLFSHELDELLDQLDGAGYLAGPGFDAYYERLAAEYQARPQRPLRDADGFGAPAAALPAYLDAALEPSAPVDGAPGPGRLRAIVAPHLDFPRGRPAYGAGYRALRRWLRGAEPPRRVVVLGTNHFGRSSSVVATDKDFQTPWGSLQNDRPFLGRVQAACGGSLTPYELDHLREHSIELQAVWLHHLLGDRARLVPFLCPDPTGPRGTAAGDPGGMDLREFARALGQLLHEDPEPTLLVASADLSHAGGYFGDRQALDAARLAEVRAADEGGLRFVAANDPESLRAHMARTGNPTRWCSIGCLYALMTALGPGARPQRLHYHQANTPELENCVSCAAFAFYD
jgi:AmmeMemoRadiSam system protein B